ncbi:FadR/GntR family transcriptional regulator [Nocardioides sp. CFH 31398]|uniref:FadR/GntR family transcriptional regulator n=1 Tax=Nocardioides sp. CFH 31398 TaxID=2919579 RepID=UPI001F063BAE|nr:FadR/GntR family transcriptional regulator [Nocardioides sp. CFH 31398]MCH1869012.1 FadR family transcriptional regulator [Nocardioides sp. CFH 31398]
MTDTDLPRRLRRSRLYEQVAEQISEWIGARDLRPGDKLPAERELAERLGVSRATLSQALVALEVVGVVEVRHGDGTVVARTGTGAGTGRVLQSVRDHADRLPDVLDARDALETKIAALAAERRTDADLAEIDAALQVMADDVAAGGRGIEADERFHAAVTAAAHSSVLAQMMAEIASLVRETRVESLGQPGRPADSLAGHRAVADAIRDRDPAAAAEAMHAHVVKVGDVALLREGPTP